MLVHGTNVGVDPCEGGGMELCAGTSSMHAR
jgi:hypothetical protein